MKTPVICLLLLLIVVDKAFPQQTGKVEFETIGLSFIIPENWTGQEGDGMYVMSNSSTSSVILIVPHEQPVTQDQMLEEADAGLVFDAGNYLRPCCTISPLNENAVMGEFEGVMNYEPVKAYVIGLSNPYGNGITVMAVAREAEYDLKTCQALAGKVKRSVQFTKPEQQEPAGNTQSKQNNSIEDWRYQLSGTRLTYMESYSSGGLSGGGYNMETAIHLCKAGYFLYADQNFLSAGGQNTTAYSSSNSKGHGEWEIITQQERPFLILKFNNGSRKEFSLEWREDNKLYMNGYRYFRTWEGEYAPNCGE